MVIIERNFWKNRRVLVTGHTGFKGSWLTLLLQKLEAKVWGYALSPELGSSLFLDLGLHEADSQTFQHCIADINDEKSLVEVVLTAQPELVFHLAAQPLVRQSYDDPIGTWNTNVLGSLRVLAALKSLTKPCAVVMVTTDKVYENREWVYGYREVDPLGGKDPYSASKAAMELAVSSWRDSFCGLGSHQTPYLAIATARAGNVIGGGDWAADRIVPDAMRALAQGKSIPVRNPQATRPWQHVLEPLWGYMCLAQRLYEHQLKTLNRPNPYARSFNFGPPSDSNRSVQDLVNTILVSWPGQWHSTTSDSSPHEAGFLHLVSDLARHQLGWCSRWDFATTVDRTVAWYRQVQAGATALCCCEDDLRFYGLVD